jgi:hypothetical protein
VGGTRTRERVVISLLIVVAVFGAMWLSRPGDSRTGETRVDSLPGKEVPRIPADCPGVASDGRAKDSQPRFRRSALIGFRAEARRR